MNAGRPPLLAGRPLSVINVGIESFTTSVRESGGSALQVEWRPMEDGDASLAWNLARMLTESGDTDSVGARIHRANLVAVERIVSSQPVLVDVVLHAREVWSDMDHTLLHAGAPVPWSEMCGPMKGSMVGALLYERWADSAEGARAMLERGEIRLAQCHDFQAVGPMSGIISPSMPVFVVKNAAHGNYAYTNMSEGIGRVLRFGANDSQVLERLRWMETMLAPALKVAVETVDGIDLKAIQAQALLMGDELHSRNAAATLQFLSIVAVALADSDADRGAVREVLRFLSNTSQFFLNLSMVASKATMDAAHSIPSSSIVTAIARNGVTTAIRVSGLGSRWFQSPSDMPLGLFFPSYEQADANPDLGVQLVGGSVNEAIRYSREMYDITAGRNPGLSLPMLDFQGAPCGIDIRRVVDTGIRPVLTTGIAHKEAGVGQIGAGIVRVPMPCFTQALAALSKEVGLQ
jgi:hypothetical protein